MLRCFAHLALLCVISWVTASAPAAADPIVQLPKPGTGQLWKQPDGPGQVTLLADVIGLGVLGADRLTTAPGYGSIDRNDPELGLARIGILARHRHLPWTGLVRVDASEATRRDLDELRDEPLSTIDSFIDEASLWWHATRWAQVILGRQRVPFTRFRQLDVTRLSVGMVPFVAERVAPDRRWGALAQADLGAVAFSLGGFEDLRRFERRDITATLNRTDDSTAGGRALVAVNARWTPRAPMSADFLPSVSTDPWHGTARVGLGFGVLARLRSGDGRIDFSVDGQLQFRRYAALTELIVSNGPAETNVSAMGEVSVALTDRVVFFSRSDYDSAIDMWSIGSGVALFARVERRSKLSLFGWIRRDRQATGVRRDGAILQIQTSL